MGKDFYKEIQNLEKVYSGAVEANVDVIVRFLNKYNENHIWGVGSGGSYSAAAAFEYLCIRAGWVARAITPLELGQMEYQIQSGAVILFTAGGSNPDTKNAYRYIAELEPEGVLTCCMRTDAAVKKIQRENLHNYYYEYSMPVAKDGYLAVESLFSTVILLTRAFEAAVQNRFFSLPQSRIRKLDHFEQQNISEALNRETLIVLHGGITTPAAIDLESKFGEVSLGNVQRIDFRNFAHGRHYWLSDRQNSTAVVALVGTSERKLADRTLRLLPDNIPMLRVDVNDGTVEGLLEAFECVLELVLKAGEIRNVNPGRPHVAEFGRKLYHLNYDIGKSSSMSARRKDVIRMAAYRKACGTNGRYFPLYIEAGQRYFEKITHRQFKGIIFDYDGTLHDKAGAADIEQRLFYRINELLDKGIRIGIATGRGKSVRRELQAVIEERFWKEVVIAYYNGGAFGTLDDDRQPDKTAVVFPDAFARVEEFLKSYGQKLSVDGMEERNPYQLTIMAADSQEEQLCLRELKEELAGMRDLKIMASSHSIDIIPTGSSKNRIFDHWHMDGYSREEMLVIGDSGQLGGNDHELLDNDHALSVDYVSGSLGSCWNFALPGMRNLEATEYYLDMIEPAGDDRFILRGNIHEV